jgi:lipoate-protein ligase B
VKPSYLGLVGYDAAFALQRRLAAAGKPLGEEWLLGLEHRPVITLGRHMLPKPMRDAWLQTGLTPPLPADLPFPVEAYRARGIEVALSDRGGQATYHGPGQLVVYPLLDLTRAPRGGWGTAGYVARLLATTGAYLRARGVETVERPEDPGLYLPGTGEKLVSVGVRNDRGITTHGLSLNVAADLAAFDLFNPCGQAGRPFANLNDLTETSETPRDVFAGLAPLLVAALG